MTEKNMWNLSPERGIKGLSDIRTGTEYRAGGKNTSGSRRKYAQRGQKEKPVSGLFRSV